MADFLEVLQGKGFELDESLGAAQNDAQKRRKIIWKYLEDVEKINGHRKLPNFGQDWTWFNASEPLQADHLQVKSNC